MAALGYLPDLPDPRDLPLAACPTARVGAVPASCSELAKHEHPILDQDGALACVGFSGAQGFWTRWSFLGGSPFLPSATWLWWVARQDHGAEKLNSGTHMRSLFKKARRMGVASSREWPHDRPFETFATQPSHLAFRSAADQTFPLAYYRLGLTPQARVEDFKRCLSSGVPVQFGTKVDRPFTELGQHDYLQPIDPKASVGGHAMLATEYDDSGVRGPNSWGMWGNAGRFALSWAWIADGNLVTDAWGIDCGRP